MLDWSRGSSIFVIELLDHCSRLVACNVVGVVSATRSVGGRDVRSWMAFGSRPFRGRRSRPASKIFSRTSPKWPFERRRP